MIGVFTMSNQNHLISFASTGGTKSSGAAADGKSGVSELSKKISGHAASFKKNALKVSKQRNACAACCGDQFDIGSPSGTRHCVVVNSPFLFSVGIVTPYSFVFACRRCRCWRHQLVTIRSLHSPDIHKYERKSHNDHWLRVPN